MDLTLTEDQQLISSTAREFLAARSPMSHVQEMETDPAGYSSALWKEMAELGWTGMALPEEFGGYGAGFLELCLIVEEMGRHLLPGPFLPTVVLAGTALAEHATDAQKSSRLAAIAEGDTILSYAGTAWGSGGPEVAVTREGGRYALTGSAMFVPYAHIADELLVVAEHRDDPSRSSAFLVPTGDVTLEPLETVGGDRHHRAVFEGVGLEADARVGEEGDGEAVAGTVSAFGTAAACAEMVGGAQRVLDMTVEYAAERRQFDAPIGSFQAIQHHCADMGVDVLTSRLIGYEAIWRLSEGLDAAQEISMAKAWVSDAYRRVCALGHQVHGAIGFTAEHDLHRYLRHAISRENFLGDAEYHWRRIADTLSLPPGA